MKSNEVNQVVSYIKTVGVDFDAADVEEDVEGVLRQYGYYESFPDEALEVLRKELLPLGLRREIREVARIVDEQMACPWPLREFVVEGDLE